MNVGATSKHEQLRADWSSSERYNGGYFIFAVHDRLVDGRWRRFNHSVVETFGRYVPTRQQFLRLYRSKEV